MQIITAKVLLFASLSDVVGVRATTVQVEEGATVADLCEVLGRRFPALAQYQPNLLYAVNAEYVPPGHLLHDGDEVALIPPVSGGAICCSR